MNTDPEFPNTSLSEDTLHSTHESATGNSLATLKQNDNLTMNVFFANDQLQKLTDEVLSLHQTTQLLTHLSNTLPEYISSLNNILASKKEFSEAEINAFFIHFYIALLPVFSLYLTSPLKPQLIAQRLQDLIELYLSFARINISCKHLTIIQWDGLCPERTKKIKEYVNTFNEDKFKDKFGIKGFAGEVLVSELVVLHSISINSLSEDEFIEAKISASHEIRNYVELFAEFADKIAYEISEKGSLDLMITNTIASNAFQTFLAVLESKPLKKDYWELVTVLQNEPFDLNFLSYLLTLNRRVSSSEGRAKYKLTITPTPKMLQRKAPFVSDGSPYQYTFEVELIADPKYDTEQNSLDFLKEFDEVLSLFSPVMRHTQLSDRWQVKL